MIAQENPVSNATGGAANCIEQIARDGILQWDSIIHFCTRSAKVRQSEQRLICCANNWIGCIGTSVFVRGPKAQEHRRLRVESARRSVPFSSAKSLGARAHHSSLPHIHCSLGGSPQPKQRSPGRTNVCTMSSASSAIDQIINFEKSDAEDYYKILGCDESSSVSWKIIITHNDGSYMSVIAEWKPRL